MRKLSQLAASAILLIGASNAAIATTYNITEVFNGVDNGFGFSGFHYAGNLFSGINGDGNPMTGSPLADIPAGTGMFGTYNDVTGAFDVTLGMTVLGLTPNPIPSFNLNGTLLYDNAGLLTPTSTLTITFNTVIGDISTNMVFDAGVVCCGSGSNPPNTFNNGLISLWGSDNTPLLANYFEDPVLGLDLRVGLTAVPVPAAAWLFGTGLLALAGVARRRA